MNNTVMRSISVTGSYQPLVAARTVASVTISCPPGNSGPVLFRGDDGSDVSWLAGEWHEFRSVNLADIHVKGNDGDIVTIVGGTW